MIVGAATAVGALLLFVIAAGLYFLPTIVGATRKVVNVGSVFAINLLLGWTLIGWAVALAMAVRTNPPHAYQQYWQPNGPSTGPSAPPAGWYTDPQGVAHQRWWDGGGWTEHTK